jgi:hypothetical protein
VAGEGGAGDDEEEVEVEEAAVVSWLLKTKTLGALPLSAAQAPVFVRLYYSVYLLH